MSKQLYDYAMNDRVELYLLIKTAEEKTTRNGKLFISFTFQDRSGEMIGNHWDATTEDVEKFQEGQVVYLEGKRDEYKG
ncbi:3'-5' exonuclease, partial [Dolosigranulum pigrum]